MGKQYSLNQSAKQELFAVIIVIITVTWLKFATLAPNVKIVDQKNTVWIHARVKVSALIVKDHIDHHHHSVLYISKNYKSEGVLSFVNAKMKFLSINCQSWNTAKKSIQNLESNYDVDIICLSETWETKKEPVKFKDWQIIAKPRKND